MTVAEHILFYSLMKGRLITEAEEEVENMVQDLGLPHKRAELIQNLSGLLGNMFTYKCTYTVQIKPLNTPIHALLALGGVLIQGACRGSCQSPWLLLVEPRWWSWMSPLLEWTLTPDDQFGTYCSNTVQVLCRKPSNNIKTVDWNTTDLLHIHQSVELQLEQTLL